MPEIVILDFDNNPESLIVRIKSTSIIGASLHHWFQNVTGAELHLYTTIR